jgi:hypothetical protein
MTNQLAAKSCFVFLIAVFSQNLKACLGPSEEDYVLLSTLSDDAKLQPVVAKVQVLTRTDQSAKVQVIDAIKGVKPKQQFTIHTSGTSCGWLDAKSRSFQPGKKSANSNIFFIAGSWRTNERPENGFIGSWKKGKRVN